MRPIKYKGELICAHNLLGECHFGDHCRNVHLTHEQKRKRKYDDLFNYLSTYISLCDLCRNYSLKELDFLGGDADDHTPIYICLDREACQKRYLKHFPDKDTNNYIQALSHTQYQAYYPDTW